MDIHTGVITNDADLAALARAGGRIYAVPISHVLEVMRPLPIRAMPGLPPYIRGVAIIRGGPVPVVDLGGITEGIASAAERFLLLQVEHRRVALAVEAVLGIYPLDKTLLGGLPPLLQRASADVVTSLGVRDQELLTVLQVSHLVPDDAWRVLASGTDS